MIRKLCDICGKFIEGYGNNAEPLVKNGICCDDCNYHVVMARLKLNQLNLKKENQNI